MIYIANLTDGMTTNSVYLCKSKNIATAKNGRDYANLVLMDKTGEIEAKIWNLDSGAIREFKATDYVQINALVTVFNGANQLNVRQIRVADANEYDSADYFPASKRPLPEMQQEILSYVGSIKDPNLKALLESFFGDEAFLRSFMDRSAAKAIHHGFIGGLPEHTLSVTHMCEEAAKHYNRPDRKTDSMLLNRDLLITGALLHDIGKVRELSVFPMNDYTDEGQLLGHITIGVQMVSEHIAKLPGFPATMQNQILHLILSHHGELEYGSPKKPALKEAFVLSFMDNMDAKLETFEEALNSKAPVNSDGWLGFNKFLDSNIRRTV